MSDDIQAACDRLFFWHGAAFAVCAAHDRHCAEELWRLVPFVKGLGKLALAHPEEAARLWIEASAEPMPFGMPPVGEEEQTS